MYTAEDCLAEEYLQHEYEADEYLIRAKSKGLKSYYITRKNSDEAGVIVDTYNKADAIQTGSKMLDTNPLLVNCQIWDDLL
jgi:23S rRNA G2069 N7-methylase RlmK/C1962 C5-methylase RlmI